MRFSNESEFEGYIRNLIEQHVTHENPSIYALKNKNAVDIVICKDGDDPALFFIEVKYHQIAHGRLGFGSGKGGGFQPEIVSRKPFYFEKNLRWALASETHIDNGVLFIPSSTIRKYVSGNTVGEKFNNIQSKIFNEVPLLSESQLIAALREWVGLLMPNKGIQADAAEPRG